MLKSYTDKYCTYCFIYIVYLFYSSSLYAKEPIMATLTNIISNETQEFRIKNYKFICKPYGIVTLERLYINAKPDSICRKSILKFYAKRKNLQYYLYDKLNVMQLYSVIFKEKKCIVNINGEKSLSEFLLDEGLALKKKGLIHNEYKFYFDKAQKIARLLKKGLWADNISNKCASSIHIRK